MLELPGAGSARGLAAVYKDGPAFEVVAVDDLGRPRPDWATLLRRGPITRGRPARDLGDDPDWGDLVERMAGFLDPARRPVALAAVFAGAAG